MLGCFLAVWVLLELAGAGLWWVLLKLLGARCCGECCLSWWVLGCGGCWAVVGARAVVDASGGGCWAVVHARYASPV